MLQGALHETVKKDYLGLPNFRNRKISVEVFSHDTKKQIIAELEAIVNDHGAVSITMNVHVGLHEKVCYVGYFASLYKGTEK